MAFADLPASGALLAISAHFTVGIGLGFVYFHSLRWSTRRFATGGRATTVIFLMLGRFALLGGVLTLTSLEGALPLLVTALGILAARAAAMRRLRGAAP